MEQATVAALDGEESLRGFLEAPPDAMVVVGADGAILLVNSRTESLFGYGPGELLRQPVEILMPERFRERHSGHRAAFAAEPRSRPMGSGLELKGRRKDGCEFPVEISLSPLRAGSGDLLTFAAIRDISERKKTEEMRAQLVAIVESSDDAIFAKTLDGRLLSWNRGAERLFGYSAEEAIGQHVSMLMPADSPDELPQLLAGIARGDTVHHYETVRRCRDGRQIELSLTLSPVRDRSGAVVGASSIARDITQAKSAERRMAASLREKDVLLKEIHHRVKNNLQVISSLLNLQCLQLGRPELEVVFEEMRNRIGSIALFHEKLYQSKDLGHVNLNEYLKELAEKLLHHHDVSPEAVKLDVDLEDVRLGVDQAIPCGLIANELVTNALKHAFSGRAGGRIRIALHRDQTGKIRLVVADDGIGIPASIDFRRTETLGLQLVLTLAEQLGGTIELDKTAGTRFEVTFAAPT